MKHCCNKMEKRLINLADFETKNHSIIYDSSWRIYAINYKVPGGRDDKAIDIFYCPWCGTKLPLELNNKWFETLEVECSITDPSGDEYDKVPSEFRTDEWWRKRNL